MKELLTRRVPARIIIFISIIITIRASTKNSIEHTYITQDKPYPVGSGYIETHNSKIDLTLPSVRIDFIIIIVIIIIVTIIIIIIIIIYFFYLAHIKNPG